MNDDGPILLFDGVCNLCAACVQFVLSHERDDQIRFASLQSDIGKEYLKKFNLPTDTFESLVLVSNQQAFIKSDAVTHLARHLRYPWRILSWFSFVPRIIGYPLYNLMAANRYRLFGKKDACWIPDKKWKSRFLG